ncbi:GGDEF domain-containing protein [Virgibacillus kekensis]|uniref:GGDEF domain-containing protein n=1 Tax=Virgibacillus kekensis TaxID=202261 RepID=A0ABV9DMG8_9BACI
MVDSLLQETYSPLLEKVIPAIVSDHLNEMKTSIEFSAFINHSENYAHELSDTLLNHCKAFFYEAEKYQDFIKKTDTEAFDLGMQFAENNLLTVELILKMSHSTRMCSIRHVLTVLNGKKLTTSNAIIFERLYELANTRQNAFFQGYIHEQNEKLRVQSYTDPLTGLFNRRYFYKTIPGEITRAHRTNCPLTLMLIDLNNLKDINDEFGHIEGDKLLEHFAKSVSKIRADFDSVFRFGGDEFVVLAPNCNKENAEEIGERLNSELNNYNRKVSLSYGVVELPLNQRPEEINIDNYIRIADTRMYKYKARYKGSSRYLCIEN